MVDALTWLLAVELLGILALPFCFVLFRRLPDRGITLAKPLALVLFSYLLWVAGLTHVVPNTQITIIVILILAAGVGGLVLPGNGRKGQNLLEGRVADPASGRGRIPGLLSCFGWALRPSLRL